MSKFMTYDYWLDNFKPIKNNISKYATDDLIAFETYGDEVKFVCDQDPKTIWTEVDGDYGTYIIAGYHYVNRIQYYITENPWEDEYTEIPTWCYRPCDCTEDEQYEQDGFNPNCEEEGCDEGSIDIPCNTVDDLKKIYDDSEDIIG